MVWAPSVAYNDLPPLPPTVAFSQETLLAVGEARASLAALSQAAKTVHNPNLLVHPFLILESQASNEIEQVYTTTDYMFDALTRPIDMLDPSLREALNYREALLHGAELVRDRPLTAATPQRVCAIIRNLDTVPFRSLQGTMITNGSGGARYTPPDSAEVITRLMSNWAEFLHSQTLDPLVRVAISHYQFEAIHPFHDGNGRTGRIMNILALIELGLLSYPVLHWSQHINQHRHDYYDLLLDVTENQNWDGWVRFMLDGVQQASKLSLSIIDRIGEVRAHWEDVLRAKGAPTGLIAVVDHFFESPVTTIHRVKEYRHNSIPAIRGWLDLLIETGLIKKDTKRREHQYLNVDVLEAVSAASTL